FEVMEGVEKQDRDVGFDPAHEVDEHDVLGLEAGRHARRLGVSERLDDERRRLLRFLVDRVERLNISHFSSSSRAFCTATMASASLFACRASFASRSAAFIWRAAV